MNDYTRNQQMVFLRDTIQLDMMTKDSIIKLAHNFNNECCKFHKSEGSPNQHDSSHCKYVNTTTSFIGLFNPAISLFVVAKQP